MVTPFQGCYAGKTVFVTGHTGFKGGWLALWLKALGAKVVGLALEPDTQPNLFESANVADGMVSQIHDIRDRENLQQLLAEQRPEFVFHLAAQPLVRKSYVEPITTFETNVIGTANLLEAVRHTPSVRAVVVVTSDKCYANREWEFAYRENDALGGFDPYSASKGAAEIVTSSYRDSFFHPERIDEHRVAVASARAGNVFGGGDWAADRLIPDCIKALVAKEPINVRNPHAVRPWQHVLEPVAAYLWLGACLRAAPKKFAGPWNFGPHAKGHSTVGQVVDLLVSQWDGGQWIDQSAQQGAAPREATLLKLDCAKAAEQLGWTPVADLVTHITMTVEWYRQFYRDPAAASQTTLEQIEQFTALAHGHQPWA